MVSDQSGIAETEGARLRLVCEGTPISLEFRESRWSIVDEASLRTELNLLAQLGTHASGLDRALGVCAALNAYLIYPDEAGTLNRQLAALEDRLPKHFRNVDFEHRIAITQACAWMHTEGAWRWLAWMLPKRLEPSLQRTAWILPGPFGWDSRGDWWEFNGNFALWLDDAFWAQIANHPDERFSQLAVATDPAASAEALREVAEAERFEVAGAEDLDLSELVALNPSTPPDLLVRLAGVRRSSDLRRRSPRDRAVYAAGRFPQRLRLRVLQHPNPPVEVFDAIVGTYVDAITSEPFIQQRLPYNSWVPPLWAVTHPKIPARLLTEVQQALCLEFDEDERRVTPEERDAILGNVASHTKASPTLRSRLADHQSHKVRARVAANPQTAPELLARLSTDRHRRVRAAAAAHANTPPEALEVLAEDPTPRVRRAVAGNEATPERALELLAADPSDGATAENAVANPSLRPSAAHQAQLRILESGDASRFLSICCREDTDAAVLRRLVAAADDMHEGMRWYYRYCLASHSNSPVDFLKAMVDEATERRDERLLNELLSNRSLPEQLCDRVADSLRQSQPREPRRWSLQARKLQEARSRRQRADAATPASSSASASASSRAPA